MLYEDLARQFRSALVAHSNISAAEAVAFSTHAIRRGAVTSLVKAKVPDHIIVARAGVVSADWVRTYDGIDLERRLTCSRSPGLCLFFWPVPLGLTYDLHSMLHGWSFGGCGFQPRSGDLVSILFGQ